MRRRNTDLRCDYLQVDFDLTQAFGWPPIIEACRNSHYTVAEQLLEWDIDVTRTDKVCAGRAARSVGRVR